MEQLYNTRNKNEPIFQFLPIEDDKKGKTRIIILYKKKYYNLYFKDIQEIPKQIEDVSPEVLKNNVLRKTKKGKNLFINSKLCLNNPTLSKKL